ncbi:TPA: serine hydrolase, partial [Bacillus thuringiensis]|nr:serine hydrolase [Bacillus thuringiensis]HDR6514872.1 serine hydrolase [Bacillus thuringiensis]
TQLLDIILSSTTIILCLLAVLLFFLGLRKRKTNEQQPMTKKRTIVTIIFLIATIAQCIMFFAFDWSTILIWQTYSVLTALISSTLLTASITWFVYTHRLDASVRK